jgi:hypothetical protein
MRDHRPRHDRNGIPTRFRWHSGEVLMCLCNTLETFHWRAALLGCVADRWQVMRRAICNKQRERRRHTQGVFPPPLNPHGGPVWGWDGKAAWRQFLVNGFLHRAASVRHGSAAFSDGTLWAPPPVPQVGCGTGPKDPKERTRHESLGNGNPARHSVLGGGGREAEVGGTSSAGTGLPVAAARRRPPPGSGTTADPNTRPPLHSPHSAID